MDTTHYLHFRIPGRGRLTLTCPDGVRRALQSGRLCSTSEVWSDAVGDWIQLGRNPLLLEMMSGKPPEEDVFIERFSAEHLAIRDEPVESSALERWAAAL